MSLNIWQCFHWNPYFSYSATLIYFSWHPLWTWNCFHMCTFCCPLRKKRCIPLPEGTEEMWSGRNLAQFCADNVHAKISCEYSAIKRWLSCRDIPRIQKISDARTIKNRWLGTKTSAICIDKKSYKGKQWICHWKMLIEGSTACVYAYKK